MQDITIESLAVVLADNPKGVLVYRDELASWFTSLTRYSKADTSSDWFQLFNALPLTVDRKTGDRLTVVVPHAAAGIVGTIQPDILAKHFKADFRGSGGAARLLLAMPPARQKVWSDREIPVGVSDGYAAVIRRLRSLAPAYSNGEPGPVPVPLTRDGKARFRDFVNECGKAALDAGAESGSLGAAFSKLEGCAARFALVHQLVTDPTAAAVGLASVEAGITLAKWFAREAERVYAALGEDEDGRRRCVVLELVRRLGGRASVRAVQKSNSRKYPTAALAEDDLNTLAAAGWGRWEEAAPPGGGHAVRELVLCSTFDTSDTRPDANAPGDPAASDTRPATGEETSDFSEETGRVSEVSNVEHDPAPGIVPAPPADANGASVEHPSRRSWRRVRNDDRPHDVRGW